MNAMPGRLVWAFFLAGGLLAFSARADFDVYFMRHGETSWNRAKVLQGSISYTELTPRGVKMAERTAEGLKRAGIVFDRIYASPYRRAVHTAEILAGGREVAIEPRIREMCFGRYEGVRSVPGAYPDENLRLFFEDPERYRPQGPGAETLAQVGARLREFLDRELVPLDGKVTRVLCVAHTLVLKALLRELYGDDLPAKAKAPFQRNCSSHVLRYTGGAFVLKDTGRIFYDPDEFGSARLPRTVAHRGAGDLTMPEASLPAFSNAVETVSDIVKLDLQRTKDGKIVLSHDPTLKRGMGWNVKIASVDYAELRKRGRFLMKGVPTDERIVRLDEALRVLKPVPEFWLDFKHFDEAFAEKALKTIRAAGIDESRLMVATFSTNALAYFQAQHPSIRRVAHVAGPEPVKKALKLKEEYGLFGVNMPVAKQATHPDDVAFLRKSGLWVSLWFVQSDKIAAAYPDADAFVTDHVTRLRGK